VCSEELLDLTAIPSDRAAKSHGCRDNHRQERAALDFSTGLSICSS
jgi:hypothetical protein